MKTVYITNNTGEAVYVSVISPDGIGNRPKIELQVQQSTIQLTIEEARTINAEITDAINRAEEGSKNG